MDQNSELTRMLTNALDMEKSGYEFYMKAARRSGSEFGKKAFEALAEDESRHIEAIRGYCVEITRKDKTPELYVVVPSHKKINERIIFGKSRAELLKEATADADELKAYEIAMKMENDGHDFYKNALKSTQDENTKDLYNFLISEEKAHFELISDTYEYLKDPEARFAREEKPFVEG